MDNKELQKMVSKFNKRVERMYNYSEGSLESLDTLRQQLFMLTGKESEKPKISLKDVKKDDRVKLVHIINNYMENPESSIRAYKAMKNKSVNTYAEKHNLKSNEIVAFNSLVKSPEFSKLKELTYKESRERMDNVDAMLSSGINGKQATEIIAKWIASGQPITFREWVDGVTHGIENGLDTKKSNIIIDHWTKNSGNIPLDNYIDYVAYSVKHGESVEKSEQNIKEWVNSQKDKKQSETIPFKRWADNAIYNKGQKS